MDAVVAVIAAVGTLAVTVGGVIGLWWMRILSKRHKLELERAEQDRKNRKDDEAARRRHKKDAVEEFGELLEATKRELGESRQEIHELRNRVGVAETKETACQIRLARCESQLSVHQEKQDELLTYIEDLEETMRAAKMPVIRRHRRPDESGTHQLPPTGDNNA